jgi:hypothetical protein
MAERNGKMVLERFVVDFHGSKAHYVEVESMDRTVCGALIPPCPRQVSIVGKKAIKNKKICKNCKRIAENMTKKGVIVALAKPDRYDRLAGVPDNLASDAEWQENMAMMGWM